MKNMWVVEWKGECMPEARLSPDFGEGFDFDIVIADTHFVVIKAELSEIEAALVGFPLWRVTGHPADGRWLWYSGQETCILDCEEVSRIELVEGLGLTPQAFGGETWWDVDWDVVWDHVPTF